jgi:hypothetical protein
MSEKPQSLATNEWCDIARQTVQRRVRTSLVSKEDLAQDILVKMSEKGLFTHEPANKEDMERHAANAARNPFRKAYHYAKRHQQLDEPRQASLVQDLNVEIQVETAELVKQILTTGTLEERATLIGPEDAGYFEPMIPGIREEVMKQETATPREKTRLRQVRSRFVKRLKKMFAAIIVVITLSSLPVFGNQAVLGGYSSGRSNQMITTTVASSRTGAALEQISRTSKIDNFEGVLLALSRTCITPDSLSA